MAEVWTEARPLYGGDEGRPVRLNGGGRTGGGQTGDDQTGNGQTGGDQTGGNQTDGGQTGGGQAGGGQTGSEQTGNGQAGGGQADNGQTNGGQTGDGQTGDGQTGDGQTGGGQTGDGQTDGDQTGSDQTGSDQTGSDQTGEQSGGQTGTVDSGGGSADDKTEALPGAVWIGLAVAAAAILAVVTALLLRRRRKKKKTAAGGAPVPAPGGIQVEKLHEQGARKNQQDCFYVSPEELRPTHGLLAVVADGMGGLADGDKVSQAAVTAAMNAFYTAQGTPEQVLLTLLGQANQAVNLLLGPDGLRSAGSTIVMGLVREGYFYYLSVGDSRICLLRDGVLYQLNREHVFRSELYQRAVNGEMSLQEAAGHPKGGGLTSFLGMGQLAHVDLPAQPAAVRSGDRFVLMSDGVYNALPEGELTALLASGGGADALRAAIQAKGYTNQDNYTAVILTC